MSEQLLFNFPFKKSYLSHDFYVAKNNFTAFKLIESWPQWPSRFINIFGPKGCGKTHLVNILMNKIRCEMVRAKLVNEKILNKYKTKELTIIARGVDLSYGSSVSENEEQLDELAIKCIKSADSLPNGIFSVDFTYDVQDIPNPTEINIGKFFTTHHFITKTGSNMPKILIDLAFNEYNGPYEVLNPCKEDMYWIRGIDVVPILVHKSEIQEKINSFDIKAPDGFPVAKASKVLYKNNQKRVDGYKVFHETIKNGIDSNLSHYFYGSNEKVITLMTKNLKKEYPKINISGYKCPPIKTYKELCEKEYVEDMIKQNPDIIWVSLGFPKQEEFILMLKNKYKINSNIVGIGAVFEWVAETKIKAPEWVANIGFEWILRLMQEPKRLFRRYLVDNFFFIIYFIRQYLRR